MDVNFQRHTSKSKPHAVPHVFVTCQQADRHRSGRDLVAGVHYIILNIIYYITVCRTHPNMLTNQTKPAKSNRIYNIKIISNFKSHPKSRFSRPGRTCGVSGSWFTQGVPFIDPPVLRGGPGDTGDPAGAAGPGVDAGELSAGGDTGEPLALAAGRGRAALWPGRGSVDQWIIPWKIRGKWWLNGSYFVGFYGIPSGNPTWLENPLSMEGFPTKISYFYGPFSSKPCLITRGYH